MELVRPSCRHREPGHRLRVGRRESWQQAPRSCRMQSRPGWPDHDRTPVDITTSLVSATIRLKLRARPTKTYPLNRIPLLLGDSNGLGARGQGHVVVALLAEQIKELI